MTVLWMKYIAKFHPVCYTSYQIALDLTLFTKEVFSVDLRPFMNQ